MNAREPAGMAIAACGIGRAAAEVEQQKDRLRAICPEHFDAALAEARNRAYTSLATFEQAVDSVVRDVALGRFPAESATYLQVAPKDPQVGWLAKWINRIRRGR